MSASERDFAVTTDGVVVVTNSGIRMTGPIEWGVNRWKFEAIFYLWPVCHRGAALGHIVKTRAPASTFRLFPSWPSHDTRDPTHRAWTRDCTTPQWYRKLGRDGKNIIITITIIIMPYIAEAGDKDYYSGKVSVVPYRLL